MDNKGNAEAGAGNGAPQNPRTAVRTHAIFLADCARAIVTLGGMETALIAVADSIPFWGHFEVEREVAEAADRLELGKKSRGGHALHIGINPIELGEGETTRAFVVDSECIGDVEYIARHGLPGIVRPLKYDDRPVVAGAIIGRSLVMAVAGSVMRHRGRIAKVVYAGIAVVNNPASLTAIFAKRGVIESSSEDTFEQIASGAHVAFAIEDGKPVLQMRNPNGRVDIVAIDTAPVRGVRLTTSRANLKPVSGPALSPAI